jgi:hypothetical protein
MSSDGFSAAFDALASASSALEKLDAGCCEPGRSPRMKALSETLGSVRFGVERSQTAHSAMDATIEALEDAGAQIGHLQIGCCAPSRLPLYAQILENLTTVQLVLNRARGAGH